MTAEKSPYREDSKTTMFTVIRLCNLTCLYIYKILNSLRAKHSDYSRTEFPM